jgi:7,8-dihydropterin-6-yl-methyl-4-(beta-D-ribofuranosyl)aminobenzene 5'-phosphate synthase
MKLTVLIDNNTLIDRYLVGEPGVCYLIEADERRILFDTGYSAAFIDNAQTLGIDLLSLDGIVLSHGHNDHSWGLQHLIQYYDRCGRSPSRPLPIHAHPAAFRPKKVGTLSIGAMLSADGLPAWLALHASTGPTQVTEHLLFLGEIPRNNDFEAKTPVGETLDGHGQTIDDFVLDDSALVHIGAEGLVIVTGCSHAGICNIVDHAIRVTGEHRVRAVIGGFHLQQAAPAVLDPTCSYFAQKPDTDLYPCHCTDLAAKISLAGASCLHEVGVGLELEFA